MQPDNIGDLPKEARHLHRAFFAGDPPAEVVDRYVAANAVCCPGSSKLMNKIVALELDAEAIELALRLRKGPTVLTKKIRILFYLLEVRSEYYGFFVGDQESRPGAALRLAGSIFETAGKYLKGAYLVRRHGLV